jgi:hypothetical protein
MAHFVGLDVSVKETSVCVVDDAGKVILEQKVPTEPTDIIGLLSSLGTTFGRIGIEAGPKRLAARRSGCDGALHGNIRCSMRWRTCPVHRRCRSS